MERKKKIKQKAKQRTRVKEEGKECAGYQIYRYGRERGKRGKCER